MLVLAVVKSIEIVGEAASRVTVESMAEAPGLPWQQIQGSGIAAPGRVRHTRGRA
jgi:uncharacterized protein with HEPN domain